MPRLYLLRALDAPARHLPSLVPALWYLEAGLLRAIVAAAARLPVDRASDLGERIGRLLGPRQAKHRHVLRNLAFVRPDWSRDRLEAAAAGVWGNLGRTVAEYPHLATICQDRDQERIEIVEAHGGGLDPVKRGERPAIFVAPHLANWNLAPVAARRLGIPLSVVYNSQTNRHVEGLIAPLRAATGAGMIHVEEAGRRMLVELRKGRSIGLLTDLRFDEGEMVPFFGVPAPTAVAPARLAVKLGIDFAPARVERLGGARFRITLHAPIRPDPGLDPRAAARQMIHEMNRLFEEWIRQRPDQWLCAKRRWPRHAAPASGTQPALDATAVSA